MPERQAVGFRVEIGEYRGVVRVPQRVFQRLLMEQPTPEWGVEAYTSSGPGSRASPSGSYATDGWLRMGTWGSADGTWSGWGPLPAVLFENFPDTGKAGKRYIR
jgi:hypothetical protein